MAFLLLKASSAQNNSLVDEHIIANFRCLTDNHTHPMIDEEPSSNLGPRMNLDTREETTCV
jgi:hypothetical protein